MVLCTARQLQVHLVNPLQPTEIRTSHHRKVILLIITRLLVPFAAKKETWCKKYELGHETSVSSNPSMVSFNCVIQHRVSNSSESASPPVLNVIKHIILLWNLGLMYKTSRIIIEGRVNVYCYNLLPNFDTETY